MPIPLLAASGGNEVPIYDRRVRKFYASLAGETRQQVPSTLPPHSQSRRQAWAVRVAVKRGQSEPPSSVGSLIL